MLGVDCAHALHQAGEPIVEMALGSGVHSEIPVEHLEVAASQVGWRPAVHLCQVARAAARWCTPRRPGWDRRRRGVAVARVVRPRCLRPADGLKIGPAAPSAASSAAGQAMIGAWKGAEWKRWRGMRFHQLEPGHKRPCGSHGQPVGRRTQHQLLHCNSATTATERTLPRRRPISEHIASTPPAVPTCQPPLAIPKLIGKYCIDGETGRGASSVVYLAFDPFHTAPGRREAASRARVAGSRPEGCRALPPHAAQRGARLPATWSRCAHIVRLLDADDDASPPYLVLEYVDGRTLAAFTARDRAAAAAAGAGHRLQVLRSALHQARSEGAWRLHRDPEAGQHHAAGGWQRH